MADQKTLLKQITEISFTVNDLTLYLDTHPLDDNALTAFKQAMDQRKQLLKTYAENFEPLTINCVCPDTNNKTETQTKYAGQKHFTWTDGPLPWEGGTV
ncbi:spore coat protein CotJB [Lacrimispora saccharolytica]|uniref:Spore coat protein CotJB n=1 Tax=Lacrimispora saccharolytica (strain ATCC 35040 / DSM 2544 / NRCC 2533 / WM1) TaxID=610130 RepID=D9R8D5_LACSW|nr:spore coat protein CotJB [Lacrimispora saccharolytica]ADL03887.1 spore coat protein CotJB [[Clostridium] saccharolyticum WM1]QRV21800.1 spore coat protein CotJB [Lacrimispora saccharolytica]